MKMNVWRCFAFLCALAVPMPAAAIADPVMGVPVQPTGIQGPPIVINECRLTNGGQELVTTSSGIQIQFTNETTKTAELINFRVDDGHQNAVIRDVGSFAPGVTILHKYKIGAGEAYFPLLNAPNLHCMVASIKFDDGTMWQPDQPPLSPGFVLYPTKLVFAGLDTAHDQFFMAQSDVNGSIGQSNSCANVADIALVGQSGYESVFRVSPKKPGTCWVTVQDGANHTLSLDVFVKGP